MTKSEIRKEEKRFEEMNMAVLNAGQTNMFHSRTNQNKW